MWECNSHIQATLFGFYDIVLAKGIKLKLKKFVPLLADTYQEKHNINLLKVLQSCKNLTEIDTQLTSVAFGYGTLKVYYD